MFGLPPLGAGGAAADQLQRPGAPARDSSAPPELAAAPRAVEAHAQAAAAEAKARGPTRDDALRRAAGERKDLHRRRQAAVGQVLRCRAGLRAAEARERELALLPAEAEAAKQKAAAAVASPGGPAPPAGAAAAAAASEESLELFQLRWDDSIFSANILEELDEQGRGSLASLRKELLAAKDLLQSLSGEVREELAAAQRPAATSRQRLAKKRNGDDGDAEGPTQAAGAAPAAPAEKAGDPASAAAAAKLSQAKFKAAEQATAAAAARGAAGSAGPGAAPPDAEDRDL
ncbi:unnamed protein product [Prorocentrum cordatum]|uniref:Uncharacterized protein n=1 Tax=Prorocentrum cordatum TaxID=2364126 RepID=A0ABN9PNT4_9DINO|nr:unnamed protein product [Polarella glacialis]